MPLRVDPRRDRKLNRLVKGAEVRRLARLEPLYDAGEAAEHVFLVRSGYLRLVEGAAQGRRERTVAVAGPWELVGDEGLRGSVRRYRCVGGEPASYQRFEGSAVFHVLKTTRRTFSALLEGYARELECARHLGTGSAGPSVRERLAYVLLDLAERWGTREGTSVLLPHRLTHQVLADLAGAHRSTVTTTLNDWIYEGILREAERRFMLASPERLGALAGPTRRPPPAADSPRIVDPRARRG